MSARGDPKRSQRPCSPLIPETGAGTRGKPLAELAKANNLPIDKAPAISAAADPGAHMIGDLLENLGITERRVQYARTAGMTVAPATAGLLLSFSMMLSGTQRQRRKT